MRIDEFWSIVERVHAMSPNDMDEKCRGLMDQLLRLPTEEVESFDNHFTDCFYQAYTWDVWGAAFVINNGCSDDSFMDFRSTLVSLGSAPFRTALISADDLADFDIDPEWATWEGYQYVSRKVLADRIGEEALRAEERKPHPQEVSGVGFQEWELSQRFPRLAAKYGYRDSDWLPEKERQEKAEKDYRSGQQLAISMLEAGIIPSCGLIPPPRIVAAVLRTGHAPASTGRKYDWEPTVLDEGHYWIATTILQNPSREMLGSRLDLEGVSLKVDTGAAGIDDFDHWIESLKARGFK